MSAILSAAQWALMRDPSPMAVMATKPSMIELGNRPIRGWRKTWNSNPVDPIIRTVAFNPAVMDRAVRQTSHNGAE